MSAEAVNRRRILAASLGAAAAVPMVACAPTTSDETNRPDPPRSPNRPASRNIRDFGAVGDGRADDTEAIRRACSVTDNAVAVYLPAGTYRVTAWPDLPDYASVLGEGSDITTVVYDGDGSLVNLQDRHRVSFKNMGFYLTGDTATAATIGNSFRCSFDSIVFRGNHLSDNFPKFRLQRGIVLERNSGGTSFVNCDINNFGIGLMTSCIQNYITSSKFSGNYIGVLGTGGDHNAGLSLSNVEFSSDNDPKTTDKHLNIDGAANDWWLTNVWFEGADIAISVGSIEQGGPAQFGMVNCKVAARTVCINLIRCRQPYLSNVQFDRDGDRSPVELKVDFENCPEGTAVNLISDAQYDIDPGVFPRGWSVVGRGRSSGPTFMGTVVARAGGANSDFFQAQGGDNQILSAVLPSGAFFSDRSDGGVILKDSGDKYWRLSVSTDGIVQTTPLGPDRPTG